MKWHRWRAGVILIKELIQVGNQYIGCRVHKSQAIRFTSVTSMTQRQGIGSEINLMSQILSKRLRDTLTRTIALIIKVVNRVEYLLRFLRLPSLSNKLTAFNHAIFSTLRQPMTLELNHRTVSSLITTLLASTLNILIKVIMWFLISKLPLRRLKHFLNPTHRNLAEISNSQSAWSNHFSLQLFR